MTTKIFPSSSVFFVSLFLSFFSTFFCLSAAEVQTAQHSESGKNVGAKTELFVAPDGSDTNPGIIEQPLATLDAAREKVRSLKKRGLDLTVYFRGGTYHFKHTVRFDAKDSGIGDQKIYYRAYGDEKPIFTSGIKVANWQKITESDPGFQFLPKKARAQVMVASLPAEISMVRHLVDRNTDWLEMGKMNVMKEVTTEKFIHGESVEGQMWDPAEEKKVCTFSRSIEGLSNVDSALIFTIYTADFELQVLPVEKIEGNKLYTSTPGGHRLALPERGQIHGSTELAFIHNLLEGIDGPGRWACNPATKKIYLWPPKGTNEIYIPKLNELIRIEGVPAGREAWFSNSKENPVRNIVFEGLTFTNAKQAIWQEDDCAAQHDWAMLDKDNALLRFRGAENCVVRGCTFSKSGGAGIAFDLYAQNNLVEENNFEYLGYEAIRFAGYGIGKKDENKSNTFRKNEIHHVNEIHQYGAAIVLWNSGFNEIKNNYIHHFASRAVLLSAPRSRAFTKNNQELFPADRSMREQAWPMARWSEIPDSALATVYYAKEEEYNIRKVEVDGFRQGDRGGLIADRRCSHFRYSRGNLIEGNIIGYGAQKLFADGIFYITGTASGAINKINSNYIYNTGMDLPLPYIPFRLIYIDGYSGKVEFSQNVAYNSKFRFETTALYNWWNSVESFANIFYDISAEEYGKGEGNLFREKDLHHPDKKYLDNYRQILLWLNSNNLPGPNPLPGSELIKELLTNTISNLGE